MDSKEEIASQLVQLDAELSKHPDQSVEVLARVMDIMSTATAIDVSKASFALGLVTEAIRPMRVRKTLLATRSRLLKALNANREGSHTPPTDEHHSL